MNQVTEEMVETVMDISNQILNTKFPPMKFNMTQILVDKLIPDKMKEPKNKKVWCKLKLNLKSIRDRSKYLNWIDIILWLKHWLQKMLGLLNWYQSLESILEHYNENNFFSV